MQLRAVAATGPDDAATRRANGAYAGGDGSLWSSGEAHVRSNWQREA